MGKYMLGEKNGRGEYAIGYHNMNLTEEQVVETITNMINYEEKPASPKDIMVFVQVDLEYQVAINTTPPKEEA